MDWLIGAKSTHRMFEIRVIIDSAESISNEITFSVKGNKNSKLIDLRKQIPEKFQKITYIWFINKSFREDQDNLFAALGVSELAKKAKPEIHLIEVLEEFNINKIDIQHEESIDSSSVPIEESTSCHICNAKSSDCPILVLNFCKHSLCRKCAEKSIFDIQKKFKCSVKDCPITLCDHEIQEILDETQYKKFQETILEYMKTDEAVHHPKIGWVCKGCTFINTPFIEFCEICNYNRPDKYKIPKYWKPNEQEMEKLKENEEISKREEELEKLRIIKENEEKTKCYEKLIQLSKESVTFTFEITECPICLIDYDPGEAIVLHSCLHTICRDCLNNYLINVNDAQVRCPTTNCIGLLEDQEIRAILNDSDYSKYQELSLRMAEAKEKFSYHCKEVNCIAWITYDGIIRSFKCPRCKKENCIVCKAIHEGMTCDQYLKTKGNERQMNPADDLFIRKMLESGEAMKCPGCGILVQKNRGCDGVTCKSCGIMMCWATKGPRWGPKGKGDTSAGCGCRFFWGKKCHPNCHYCH